MLAKRKEKASLTSVAYIQETFVIKEAKVTRLEPTILGKHLDCISSDNKCLNMYEWQDLISRRYTHFVRQTLANARITCLDPASNLSSH
jgi:hypothetical protein